MRMSCPMGVPKKGAAMKTSLWLVGAMLPFGLLLGACSSTSSVTSGTPQPNQTSSNTTSNPSSQSNSSSNSTPPAKSNAPYALGTTVKVPETDSGISSVQVSAWYPGVTDTSSLGLTPSSGHVWDAIVATECAGSGGASTGPNPLDFSVILSNESTASESLTADVAQFGGPLASLSQLGGSSAALAAGQCSKGWVVFSVPNGTTPIKVEFSGTSASFSASNSDVQWAIPQG